MNRTPPRTEPIGELLARFVGGEKSARLRARRALLTRPEEALPAAIAQLRGVSNGVVFRQLADLVGRIGSDEAAEELAELARTHRRFAHLATSALVRCNRETAGRSLVDLTRTGGSARRRSAVRALGRLKPAIAICRLCEIVVDDAGKAISREAREALRRYGREPALTTSLLLEPAFTDLERVRALRTIEDLRFGLIPFRLQRHLDDLARNGPSRDVCDSAARAAAMLRDQTTLLRPAGPTGEDTLLRPAMGIHDDRTDTLLRPAAEPQPATDAPSRMPWWRRVLGGTDPADG